ncbi:MAG: aminotransferase class I/II-fold pyridoxal phosphate-dependent enzyme [Spirochaetaceae bacterium]|jgi:cystathionine beta-lyase|nr:aminotransferase class I/II-fold pyridoxal phosphate-dependent enzyme [Spirochaetaceae bacterium]
MKYDFSSIMDRHGKDSIAVDLGGFQSLPPSGERPGVERIPMAVADMNFPLPPCITDAIIDRVKHPAFGYFAPRDEYYKKIIDWHKTQNNVHGLKTEHIGYQNGVLGGVISALNIFCSRGDNVLIHSPTYVGFTHSLVPNGYHIIHSPLKVDAHNIWRMDFADMEKKIIDNKIHAAIFCSPHNPCGRVWERGEIEEAMALYKKHDVFVISDEIWSDLLLDNNRHIPTQSINDDARNRSVALYAPSKTFNLAGLIGSYHIVYNQYIKDRLVKESSLSHYNSMNMLSMYALLGAYTDQGREWLSELREVLSANVNYACDYITKNFPAVQLAKPQGTYMIFPDFTEWCKTHNKTIDELYNAGVYEGVFWQKGTDFQAPNHLRLNLALPLSRIQEAFRRLEMVLK